MADIEPLYKRAEESFTKKNYDYAIELFKQILAIDPNHEKSRKGLRATVIQKFKEGGATSRFKLMAISSGTQIKLKTTKDTQKKIEICQDYLLDDPTNSKIRSLLAEQLLALNHYNGAAVEAEMAMEGTEANVPAAKVLVSALARLKRVKEAQAILQRYQSHLKEDRDLEKLQRDLAAMQTMSAGFEDATGKEGFRKVIKNAEGAAQAEMDHRLIKTDAELKAKIDQLEGEMVGNPTDAKLPKKVADIYFDNKKDYAQAREWYKKASQLAPQDSVLRDKVDDCNLRIYDQQIEAAQKNNDPKLSELRISRLKFRIQSFERRVADRPTDMVLRFELGTAYFLGGLVDKAIAEFQQSVKDPKRKPDSHFYLGRAFQKKKMYDMADKQYENAEQGVLSQDRKLDILYNRAICNSEAGKKDRAIEIGKTIMEVDIAYKDISELVEKWTAA